MKLYCPPSKWSRTATAEAVQAGLDPALVLAGDRRKPYVQARWRAWERLYVAGYSYASIGATSGWHHTVIMHGCKPQMRESRIKKYYSTTTRLRAVSERS